MASKKNRPNKAERQRRNRQRREARQARSAHDGEASELYQAEESEGAESTEEGERAEVASKRTSGSRAGRMAEANQARKSARNARYQYPGQRAVVLSFLFAIASVVLLVVSPIAVQRDVDSVDDGPAEIDEDEVEVDEDDGSVTYTDDVKLLDEETLPVALAIMLVPVAITGAAAYYAKHPKRGTIWTMAMLAMAAYVFFLAGPYGFFSLASLIALGVGGFQARRDENKERMAELRAEREARKAAKRDGEVIDVDAVEEGTAESPAAEDDGVEDRD